MTRRQAEAGALLTIQVVTASCLRPNPEFDPTGEKTTSTATTITDATTSAPTTSTTTGTDTTAPPTDGTASTSMASSGATSGATTGAPADCWDAPVTEWDSIQKLPDGQLGGHPIHTHLTADGLGMYYMAKNPLRPHRSQRGSLDELFTVGEVLIPWPNFTYRVDYPRLWPDELEIVIAGVPSMPGKLLIATRSGATWSDPIPMSNEINTGVEQTWPTLDESSTHMIWARQDGPVIPDFGATWSLYEATRPADSIPGTSFGAPSLVTLPGITDKGPHINICPALSPDALHLFFGSTYPDLIVLPDTEGLLNVHHVQRAGPDKPWSTADPIDIFHEQGKQTCPDAISRDGCTMLFERFVLGEASVQVYLARRSP